VKTWFQSLQKNTIAFLAIAGGIVVIIMAQPPHTVCDSQIEVLTDSQKHFLYKDPPDSKVVKTTPYQVLREGCKAANNPGGCYELFQKTRDLLDNLGTLPNECMAAGGDITEVHDAVWQMAELMTRLAWGEKPPTSYYAKFRWLDTADVSLFCKLKAKIGQLYGESAFNTFRERMMRELPGAKDLTRNQVWEMSLFSENCSRYP
jgi:hypothetical protein